MFINKYSVKCLLGPRSKVEYVSDDLFCWSVNGKNHFSILGSLTIEDIEHISSLGKVSFHYCSAENLELLKKYFKVDKTKITNVILDINNLDFVGKKGRQFRNYLNKYKDLRVVDNFNSIDEIEEFINKWSDQLADKYFRDHSGKNLHFFRRGSHIGCENIFIYKDYELVAFGVASPMDNGSCSYIVGKALAKSYPGMSEFADIMLYRKLLRKYGAFKIDMGMGAKGLLSYKMKFPGAIGEINYHGIIVGANCHGMTV
jgi:hypothetical protein